MEAEVVFSPQQRRLGFLIRRARFLICCLSFPINLLCIYSVFLWTEWGNVKHNRHRINSLLWNPAANSPWSWTANDLKLLQIWVWSSEDSSKRVKRNRYWEKQASGKDPASDDVLHVPAAFSYQVRQSPAPVGGQTAGGRQPGTDSSHWTELGPGGWRVVPGMGTAIKHSITTMNSTFSEHHAIQMDCKDPMCTCDSVKIIWFLFEANTHTIYYWASK